MISSSETVRESHPLPSLTTTLPNKEVSIMTKNQITNKPLGYGVTTRRVHHTTQITLGGR